MLSIFTERTGCDRHYLHGERATDQGSVAGKMEESQSHGCKNDRDCKKYGLNSENKAQRLERKMGVEGSREERTVRGNHYEAVYGDCVEETRAMETNSIDLIHTSIPFGNHYEYSANYNDFGHNQNTNGIF